MQEGKNRLDRKRVTITSVTTLAIAILPTLKFPAPLLFMVPAAIELTAMLGFFIWAWSRLSRLIRKKNTASENVRKSLEDDIERLKFQISQASSPRLKKQLENKMGELYDEQLDESAAHRKNLREDIKRYGEDSQLLQLETQSIKHQLAQKVDEELKKAGESFDKPQHPHS